MIHRDIKLENVMMSDLDTPKIVDLGFGAFCRADTGRAEETADCLTQMYGTPLYMAPEVHVKVRGYRGGLEGV
jgi:serine/threonine protein kinase